MSRKESDQLRSLFIDSSHMKASANKNKATIELVEEQGKYYQDELDAEIKKERPL